MRANWTTASPIGALTLGVALTLTACGGGKTVHPWQYEATPFADTLAIVEPEEQKIPLFYEVVNSSLFGGGSGGGDAWNADPFDGVVNSTWFEHRNSVSPLTPDDIRRGPQRLDGPDTSGPLTVTSIKAEGVTPGFNAKDAAGARWIIKFDPPDKPELASGAEVVATNLAWAAGYNTPENYVFLLNPDNLALDDDLEMVLIDELAYPVVYSVTGDGDRRLTKEMFMDHVLSSYPRRSDGTIRALASRFLDGIPLGPFSYSGVRFDDPNDVIPHEHRRELRGLYSVAAWLNHTDVKSGNSLDMLIPAARQPAGGTRIGYVKHHLIDFGSTLGSAAFDRHIVRDGDEHLLDVNMMKRRLLSFGLYRAYWQKNPTPETPPALGYYSLDNYNPGDWRPNLPNAAFGSATPADAYWGAKLVMSFTDQQLAGAVDAAQYSDPANARQLLEVLRQRRDATGRYWFAQVTPIENVEIDDGALTFDDNWIEHFGGTGEYRYEFDWDAPDPDLEDKGTVTQQRIPLPVPSGDVERRGQPEDDLATLEVWSRSPLGGWVSRPATLWLAWNQGLREWHIVGIRH
jgi:hypothetical protein